MQLDRLWSANSGGGVPEEALPIACCFFDHFTESAKYGEVILRKQGLIVDVTNPGMFDQVKCWGNKQEGWCEKSRVDENYALDVCKDACYLLQADLL